MPGGAKMATQRKVLSILIVSLFVAGSGEALHSGVGGNANGQGEVSIAGCTCHAEEPDNSVTVIIDGVPFHYAPDSSYEMKLQLIGGPEANLDSHTAGFAMTVTQGSLSASEGFDSMVQNWEGDPATLTHTDAGSRISDRSWMFVWTSPSEGSGSVVFNIAGNSVNGDLAPSSLDRWNRLTTSIDEGEDNGRTKTVFSGNGDINPPAPVESKKDIHKMGAKLLAHWLGLLGFGAAIFITAIVSIFMAAPSGGRGGRGGGGMYWGGGGGFSGGGGGWSGGGFSGGGGGFGSKITVGNITDIQARIDAANGFLYVPEGRMWVTKYPAGSVKKAETAYSAPELAGMRAGLVALYQKCPHLGCRVPECQTSQWFECPCHGSQYNRVGEKRGGPAPRGMDRFAMEVKDGVFIVDTGTIIQGPPIGVNTMDQYQLNHKCKALHQ